MPVFPLNKFFLQGSVTEQPQDNVRRTDNDAGPQKTRRRYTAKVNTFNGQLFLNGAEKKTLKLFFDNECADGAVPFTWIHPFEGTPVSMRLVGTPQFQHVSGSINQGARSMFFRCSLTVEILP
ncbi:MAG: hypothetical protein EKK48_12225 [Candidatus Melainabacteria bacterium]|nr:MAG: hypothetical protein EKK48_12225 [Candidatus Melainabacteria bacterium]